MTAFNPRHLRRKMIARVELHRFDGGRGVVTDPVIHFTDGSSISFYAQETDGFDCGIGIIFHKADRGRMK